MEYRDKRTLSIMSSYNKNLDEGYSYRKYQREKDRKDKKNITNFYLRNIYFIDKIWWSLLSKSDRECVYLSWTDYVKYNNDRDKKSFFINMMAILDKRKEIREKKLQSLL